MEYYFYLEEWLTYKRRYLADTLSKIRPSIQGKQLTRFDANDKTEYFKRILKCSKTCISHCELFSFLKLEDISDELSNGINKCDFSIVYHKTCQWWEDSHNSVNQFFWVINVWCYMNDVRESQMLTQYEKFLDVMSDSTLQLTFKKWSYVGCQKKKSIYLY